MKNILKKVKNNATWLLTVFIMICLAIPFVFMYLYLKKQNKTLQIHPEFKIKDQKTEDFSDLNEAINEAKKILEKVKK